MKGVLLAGGTGGRLRPLTNTTAKVMVEVGGRPMLGYSLDMLVDADVTELVVVVGYRGDDIVEHYGPSYRGTPIRYVRQKQPRGTAHALLSAAEYLNDDFHLVLPDNIYGSSFDVGSVAHRHRRRGVDATVVLDEGDEARAKASGVAERRDDGSIQNIIEKPAEPPSQWILCGAYVFSPKVLSACNLVTLSSRGEYELTDALDLLLQADRRVAAVELDTWVVNVNTPEDCEIAENRLAES